MSTTRKICVFHTLNMCCLRVFNALIFHVQTTLIYRVKYVLNMREIHIFYVFLDLLVFHNLNKQTLLYAVSLDWICSTSVQYVSKYANCCSSRFQNKSLHVLISTCSCSRNYSGCSISIVKKWPNMKD